MDHYALELLPMSDNLLVIHEYFPLDFLMRKFNSIWRSFSLSNNCLALLIQQKQLKMFFFPRINFLILGSLSSNKTVSWGIKNYII